MDRGEIQGAPKNFEALRTLILERRRELPKRLAQVAAFALDHPDEIAFGTAASIAIEAQVQPSTLVRFAQTFGFDGFSALQAVFRARLRERIRAMRIGWQNWRAAMPRPLDRRRFSTLSLPRRIAASTI